MGAQPDKKENKGPGAAERGSFTVGQLYQLGSLPKENYVEISRDGTYTLNSVTSRDGVFAARIRLFDGLRSFWIGKRSGWKSRVVLKRVEIEWRQRSGLDALLNNPAKKSVLQNPLFGTLLVRLHRGQRKETELVGILAQGESLERSGVKITHSKTRVGEMVVKFKKLGKKEKVCLSLLLFV
jgi:hypothetical protein